MCNKKCAFLLIISVIVFVFLIRNVSAQVNKNHNLVFDIIPTNWDEGIPLGNGMLGALIWQKGDKLRISVDRADLWDLRPTKEIEKYSYDWAHQQKLAGEWDTVWKVADEPYDRDPAPTKLPGAAIEFDISGLGKVKSVSLDLKSAICIVRWENMVSLMIGMDAVGMVGRYKWEGASINPHLIAPAYLSTDRNKLENQVVDGQDLQRLGYSKGKFRKKKNLLIYDQQCWGPLKYQASVGWKKTTPGQEGAFSISSHYEDNNSVPKANSTVRQALISSFDNGIATHKQWWNEYWNMSSIDLPDAQLEKQWYLEIYKFGAASRKGAPPISLQSIWTADNGKLPPWKGDFHNDLNTQLSYWPAYSSNHLDEGSVFTDWLWQNKTVSEAYTRQVFNTSGINVPGVATLRGKAMGGWHMYAMSPTVSCWLAQHFYLQWKYSMDRKFLEEKAYPWVQGVANYLEQVSRLKEGKRVLPMSSSPEFHDGGINAWFLEMTNYDRALCKFVFTIAAELAAEFDNSNAEKHWNSLSGQIPDLDVDSLTGLTIAPGFPYQESHRHFSHLMSIYPLALLHFDDPSEREIMIRSIENLEKHGSDWWCGYSYSWLGNLYARVKEGNKAAKALKTFSSCFCSINSFHVNGNQCKEDYSKMRYRPFTLEGNFAFASGIQEMLIQSYSGVIEIFPAIPDEWKDVSFKDLRAQGAFLVSADKLNGVVTKFSITSEKGGTARIKLPFRTMIAKATAGATLLKGEKDLILVEFVPGGRIEIENGYE